MERLLILLTLILLIPSIYSRLHKCCPRGFEFSVIVSEDGHQSYDCMPERENMTVFDEEDFFGDFTTGNEKMSFPSCSERRMQLFRFTRELISVSPNSCVDVIQGDYILLTCSSKNPIPDALTVLSVRKCCGQEFVYDIKARECVVSGNSTMRSILPPKSSPLFIRGAPECRESEVMVMLMSGTHEIAVSGATLMITTFDRGRPVSEFVDPNSFCVDSAPSEEDENRWMTRVCRHESICERIPCVRKCCGHEKKMARVNNKATCLSHSVDINPTFHILDEDDFPDSDPPTAEPRGENSLANFELSFYTIFMNHTTVTP